MQGRRRQILLLQAVRQIICHTLGVAEHQRHLGLMNRKQPYNRFGFFVSIHHAVPLVNGGNRQVRFAGLDKHRISLKILR